MSYADSAAVPADTLAAYPLMSFWVALKKHALTFLRSAFRGSPAGSNYLTPGSWPNGVFALAPLNLLSACLRLSPSSAVLLYQPCVPAIAERWFPLRLPFRNLIPAHRAVLFSGYPVAHVCCRYFSARTQYTRVPHRSVTA